MASRASASVEAMERLWIVWSGFHDGALYASRHPLENPSLDAERIVATAAAACEHRRHASPPLNWALAHPAYTDGWVAGYLATQRELAGDADEAPRESDAEQLCNVVAFPSLTR